MPFFLLSLQEDLNLWEVTWIYEVTMDFNEAVIIFVMWSLRIFSHDSFTSFKGRWKAYEIKGLCINFFPLKSVL